MCKDPTVSIIVNCRNSARYLSEALSSIYAQTYADWEIILVDNASTDGTADIVKGWDKRLRYFYSDIPLKLGAARNMALAQCRGSYIAFLDSDDRWLREKLEVQLKLFDEPNVGLVYTNCLSFTDKGISRVMFRDEEIVPAGLCFDVLLEKYCVVLSSVVARKESLESAGMHFDEGLEVAEEFELFMRLAYSHAIGYCSRVLTQYRVHAGSDSWKKFHLFWIEAQYIVNKLQKIFPNFEERFSSQAEKYLRSARFGYAISLWRQGKSKLARNELGFIRPQSTKIRIVKILTNIPFKFLRPIIELRSRRIYPD